MREKYASSRIWTCRYSYRPINFPYARKSEMATNGADVGGSTKSD
ncbi:Protein of unknown function [Pyronema omphalodes CBS 100304]|uniref:Uncharacterized protein n=1 Tax=Pyronema omphalodes (strain CBS 100304) TaxID=1076935 RepID=U4LNS6_PYROM|nr:Protein of unknown function [Pyronema omphalodes CBS 100304]